MLRFVIDETNRHVGDDGFFIVGGLIFNDEQTIKVHQGIEQIRIRHGFQPTDKLKFQTSSRPEAMPAAVQTLAKNAVIKLLAEQQVKMVTYLGINAIIKSKSEDLRMKWALDALVLRYLHFLELNDDYGEMIMDRDDTMIDHLRERFQSPALFRNPRQRLFMFGTTSDGLSHLSSAVDIALGGFRYCVNKEAKTDRDHEVAQAIFGPITQLMWGIQRQDGVKQIGGYGFNLRPKAPRKPAFKQRYEELTARLTQLGNADARPVTPGAHEATEKPF